MANQMETLSRFGKSFQEKLCQLILEDRPFCDQISEVLNINFLELKYLQVFVETIFNYRDRYKTHPTYELMATMLKSGLREENDGIKKQVRDYYARIMSGSVQGADYIKEQAIDFCKKQVLKEAMIKSVKLLKSSSYDEIQKIINDALRLGVENNFGHDYLKDFEQRFVLKPRFPVSTGWERVDELCQGGLGRRELGVVIAPTGAGKSMVLCHLGSHAVKEGKTIVHYTLELADRVVGQRYDSCISGVPLGDLFANKEKVFDTVQDLEGQLIIKEYPTKSASTSTIKSHLEKLRKRSIEPDMIIVDYADLLKPTKSSSEKRHELENIYEELRAIAQVHNCPVWTASQTNRSGLNAEVITMESISEAFNKCFVADFIFSLSRTIQDKQANKGRVFVAKNRNGPDGLIFPTFIDWSTICMKVLENTGEETDEAVKETTANALKYLKSKYEQHKK